MKRTAFAAVCVLLLSVAVLWARDDRMINSSVVPAATGSVHTEHDRNGNTELRVSVAHLAKPHDLSPSYNSYVVWIQSRDRAPVNAGELKVNDDLRGDLRTSTPEKQFDVFVTAENNPRAETPSGPQVLHTTISH